MGAIVLVVSEEIIKVGNHWWIVFWVSGKFQGSLDRNTEVSPVFSLVGYGNDASRRFNMEIHDEKHTWNKDYNFFTLWLAVHLCISFYLLWHLIPTRRSSILPPALAVPRRVQER